MKNPNANLSLVPFVSVENMMRIVNTIGAAKMIAEMAAATEMMRSFLYSVAKDYDAGNKGPNPAAMVKLVIPKLVTKIALDAIQLHGGYGYSREFPLERYMRDNKLMEIGAGTSEIRRMLVGRELMGAM